MPRRQTSGFASVPGPVKALDISKLLVIKAIVACTLIALIDSKAIFADGGTSKTNDLRRTAMNSGGNADRGKIIFESANAQCAVCHKVHGKGGEVGPDLSQIGGKFDRTHLIESILDPSAEILQVGACVDGHREVGVRNRPHSR